MIRGLVITIFAVAGVLALTWLVLSRLPLNAHAGASGPTSRTLAPSGVEIANPDEALTFARYESGGRIRLLRVRRYADGEVTGADITDRLGPAGPDPVRAYAKLGYEGLAGLSGPLVTVSADALPPPFDGVESQIAMGVNYGDHRSETRLQKGFLFPKNTPPGRWNQGVSAGEGLLDYELELGFVALEALKPGERPERMGLVLASDYTDRATLLRSINLRDISSGQGFTQAKSKPGYMPVGAFLVIPRDLRAFYPRLELTLNVNGDPRQRAHPKDLIWDIDQMLRESFARDRAAAGSMTSPPSLELPEGRIAPGTIILSGTPEGVVFRPPTGRQLFLGVLETVGLLRWGEARRQLVEPTIREARRARIYLQPGDQVVMQAPRLGVIANRIIP